VYSIKLFYKKVKWEHRFHKKDHGRNQSKVLVAYKKHTGNIIKEVGDCSLNKQTSTNTNSTEKRVLWMGEEIVLVAEVLVVVGIE